MRDLRPMTVTAALAACALAAYAAEPAKPPSAPLNPVTETLWGRPVTDNYRYMETLEPATIDWMKAQGAYTRAVFDGIKPLGRLQADVGKFTASFGLVSDYSIYGGRSFYKERAPGADNFDLLVSDGAGTRKLVDIAALRAANGGKPYAINYFLASPDGSKVAVGISEGGSENAEVSVYDAATGKRIAGPLDRAQFGATAWTEDSRVVFFNRLKKLSPQDPPTEKYQNSTLEAWDLQRDPVSILGARVGHGPAIKPAEFPVLNVIPGAPMAVAVSINGVQNELAAWLSPVAKVRDPKANWTAFIAREDEVTALDMRGADIFVLSHKDAPTFKVLTLHAGQALSAATVLVPAQPDRVIEGIHAAADALYVLARRGSYSVLLRVPKGSTDIEEVPLPLAGHINDAFADPRAAGVAIDLSSWVVPPDIYSYKPGKAFSALKIGTHGDIDPSAYLVSDLEAPARDGVAVPLSLISRKGAKGTQITLLEAYGSYGISELADFSSRRAVALREGITYGVCHVRGGGELGEAWRLGGKDANKHNTWDDLIACAEFLVGRGTTAKQKLFIMGGSAGGITMGRSLTERPDLFAGVLDLVPSANTLRAEFTPGGPANIPEFGTVATQAGLENLFMMDTIAHVKKDTQYPAVLITTGLNDPRVAPWEPAKLAAALQASDTSKPVLLRIDEQAGHGIGSTKSQTDALGADSIAFIFWQAGLPEWQPN